MNVCFKYIEICYARTVKLGKLSFHADYNKYSNMIKTIQNTSFPNLLELRLGDNTIASIELLCAIHMPNIKTLLLSISLFYLFFR